MNFSAPHVMLDIETLGTGPHAVILSIAAVWFYPDGSNEESLYFYRKLHIDAQLGAGRYVTDSTFRWWMRQADEVRVEFFNADAALAPKQVLGDFKRALDSQEFEGIWGNGADFDNANILSLAEDFGFEPLWPYWKNRCFRTFTSLHDPGRKLRPQSNDHNALNDCRNQIRWMQSIVRGASELVVED